MPGAIKVRDNKNGFSSNVAGSPSRITVPQNRGIIKDAIYKLYLEGTAATSTEIKANFPSIILNINGDDFSKYRADDLLMLELFNGDEFVAGTLTLPFSNHTLSNVIEQDATAFAAAAYNNPVFILEVDEDATVPTFTQELSSEGLGDEGRKFIVSNPLGAANMTIKHYRTTVDILTSGDEPTSYHYTGGGKRIKAFHFNGDNVTRIRMLVNEQEWFDFKSVADLNRRLKRRGFVPQTNYWHIDLIALADSINGAFDPMYGGTPQRVDFEVFTSDTDDVSLLVEQYDRPETLPANTATVA